MSNLGLSAIRRDLITESNGDDWYVLPSGPFSDGHDYRAVHRARPELTIAWGLTTGEPVETESPEWASCLDHKEVRRFYLDIHWFGSPIDRIELLWIDQSATAIPVFDWQLNCNSFALSVAELIHVLGGGLPDVGHPGWYLDLIRANTFG